MPVYEVLHDVSVPTGEMLEQPGGVKLAKYRDVPGGIGETVDLSEEEAAPLVKLGILAVPEVVEQTRKTREKVVAAHDRAEEARSTAAVAAAEAEAIEQQGREEAASRVERRPR